MGSKLLLLYGSALLMCVYVWLVVRKLEFGASRLMAALPAVCLLLAAPLLLDPFQSNEAMLITPIGGIYSLAAFKLLAFCEGRGPLSVPLTPPQFAAVFMAPIIPARGDMSSAGRSPKQLSVDYFKEIGGASVVCSILLSYPNMHWFPRHWLYTLCSCLFLGAIFDILAAAAGKVLDMPVTPAFNRPWLSDSFADFWARRWNLTTTYLMRAMIYEPIMQGRFVAPQYPGGQPTGRPRASQSEASPAGLQFRSTGQPDAAAAFDCHGPQYNLRGAQDGGRMKQATGTMFSGGKRVKQKPTSKLRAFLALQATFMFSGVWHILVFYYNCRLVSYRWALFFILQAPIIMCERLVGKAWQAAYLPCVPRALRVVLTNAALIAIAGPLFFGPADDTGFVRRNIIVAAPFLQQTFAFLGLQPVSEAISYGTGALVYGACTHLVFFAA